MARTVSTGTLFNYLERKGYLSDFRVDSDRLRADFPDDPPVDEGQQKELSDFAMTWTRVLLREEDGAKRRSIVLGSCSTTTDAAEAMFTDVDLCACSLRDSPLPSLKSVANYQRDLHDVSEWGKNLKKDVMLAIDNFRLKLNAWETDEFRRQWEIGEKMFQSDPRDATFGRSWQLAGRTIANEIIRDVPRARSLCEAIRPYGQLLWRLCRLLEGVARFGAGHQSWPDELDQHCNRTASEEMSRLFIESLGSEDLFSDVLKGVSSLKTTAAGKSRVLKTIDVLAAGSAAVHCVVDVWLEKRSLLYSSLKEVKSRTYVRPLQVFKPSCFVWYDVRDSRSKRTEDPSRHSQAVSRFKERINAWLQE